MPSELCNTTRMAGTAAILSICCAAVPASADVVISTAQTQNMACASGVCAPTAASAVLNAGDLETMLASGSVKVTTTGSGIQANNIDVKAPFSWSAANTLSLDAWQSIEVAKHVSVAGTGGLTLTTNDGGANGTFSTGPKGRVSFANLSSALTINGADYTLIGSVQTLASAITANPSGNYALADNYNASKDGTYSNTPITTTLTGTVEGLGNAISNLNVSVKRQQFASGLFSRLEFGSVAENLGLEHLLLNVGLFDRGVSQDAAGFVAGNFGLLFNDHVAGTIIVDAEKGSTSSLVAGLAAYNSWIVANSYSTANIKESGATSGGLVGYSIGLIAGSFAAGNISSKDGDYNGGLVATNQGQIENSYATGSVKGTGGTNVGGFIGGNGSNQTISASYSTGHVARQQGLLGGFIGEEDNGGLSDCDWDTQTSGTSEGTGGGNVSGLTGLTTKELQSGLPAGFDPSVWAQSKKINNGFPYLIANPPPEK